MTSPVGIAWLNIVTCHWGKMVMEKRWGYVSGKTNFGDRCYKVKVKYVIRNSHCYMNC